jgi:hypothetical protein
MVSGAMNRDSWSTPGRGFGSRKQRSWLETARIELEIMP